MNRAAFLLLAALPLACASACGDDDAPNGAGNGDITSRYAHVTPPGDAAPAIFQPGRWVDHLEDDLLPYWTMEAARGDPVGNFPTYRTMTGEVATPTQRRPRMLSRQTYAYSIGYLLTGDPELLRL